MPSILERRIAEFVDRMAEMQGFSGFVESRDKLVLFIWGPTGLGKSSLLARMSHECKRREIHFVAIECQELGLNTYQQIMCELRDELKRPELFQEFSQLTELFAAPRQVNLSIVQTIGSMQAGASVKGAEIGTVNVPSGGDAGVPEAERMVRLTEQFVGNLERVTGEARLVILLDDTHKMTSETTLWLWAQLLKRLLEDRLQSVRFVVAARERPQLDRYMWDIIEEVELQPLGVDDIAEYLKRREVFDNDETRFAVAQALHAATKGNAMGVANAVDSLKANQKKKALRNG